MIPRLVVLTDRSQLRLGRGLVPTLEECRAAGLTHVVLRELDLPEPHRRALAAELGALGLEVIAAHRPLPGCAGVQLAAHQPVADAAGVRHGRSCHAAEEVRRAAAGGAAWATLGPFAPSASKPGRPPLAHRAYDDLPIPVLALAGIGPANAAAARSAGAHGVAVMGAVMRAAEPADVVAILLREVGR